MKRNTGRRPREAQGKRVRVILVNGYDNANEKGPTPGWAADSCNWQRTKGKSAMFDIDQYEVL